jgi:hypothetical protein
MNGFPGFSRLFFNGPFHRVRSPITYPNAQHILLSYNDNFCLYDDMYYEVSLKWLLQLSAFVEMTNL